MKKYIELTEYDNNGRNVIFADSIQGLIRVRDRENDKEFTEVMVSGYTFLVNETIDEILERMGSDQGHLDGIDVLDKIKTEIEEQVLESLSDGGDDWFAAEKVNECLEIIDKYKVESEDKE